MPHVARRRTVAALAFILFPITGLGVGACAQETAMTTHVTIQVDGPLLERGGVVLVVGGPVTREVWRQMFDAGERDPDPARAVAVARSPATAVELSFPEEGTYTFNLEAADGRALRTQELTVGTGSVFDPETKTDIEWPFQSAIHVAGNRHDPSWARGATDAFSQAFRNGEPGSVRVAHYEAGRILELSNEAITRFIEEAP